MESVVGKPVTRVDALDKVSGAAVFGPDVKLAGMLYAKVLRSSHAHARIVSINVEAARKLAGVRTVVVGADMPDVLGGEAVKDMPFLALGKVRYMGEPVAAVAAEDEDTAARAIELIEVVYDELPVAVDALVAIQKGASLIHEGLENYERIGVVKPVPNSNLITVNEYRKGDVEQGFRESDYVFEDDFRSHTVHHAPLEPHSAVAQVDVGGRVVVWVPNDSPHRLRKDLADALHMRMDRVRVISTYVGGGFGGKGGLKAEPIAVALALKTNHRPVKVVFTREEVFQATLVRHATVVHIKTGVKKDGTLTARDVKVIWDTGAYAEKGPTVCSQATAAAAGPYRIPHVRLAGYCVYTNKVMAGAYRGYGTPQIAWAHESQMDIIAKKLEIDPLELRLRNVLREGDINPVGNVAHSVGLEACLKQVAESIGWVGRERHPRVTESGRYQGFGIACGAKNTKTPSGSEAALYLHQDGSLNIVTASVEVGQGVRTILAQIACGVLGIPMDGVSFSQPDTDCTPFDASTTSSRTTFHMGNAIKLAAEDLKGQLAQLGASVFDCEVDQVVVEDGKAWIAGRPDGSLTYHELLQKQYGAGASIMGRGFYYPKSERGKAFHTSPSLFWMYGAHAVQVEVDSRTGHVDVKRLAAAADTGWPINPVNCLQQIEGGAVHGIGTTLLEELIVDDRGRMLNPNFHDYKLPTAMDAPEILPSLAEAPHKEGPFGAKGMGEIVTTSVPAAIGNAIEEAVGVRLRDLPITSEKLWRALKESGFDARGGLKGE
jgi:carbon-monoxide dehydrogenase large subunit